MVLNIYTIMSKLLFHIFISLIELFYSKCSSQDLVYFQTVHATVQMNIEHDINKCIHRT